jgi:aspartyl-tRNA(Asn)/glutamyl-tRNA(Gln) amidotransferase subunit A
MDEHIFYSDATELASLIRTKKVSPVEVMKAHLDRIDSVNPKINAIVTLADDALDRAREAESEITEGALRGPLHGVPFTMKEVFDSAGVKTTRGSRVFADRVPTEDSAAVARLKAAGGILVGKTNAPEFALASETSNVLFGKTSNPWDQDLTAGGSSGGEAAAIGAGLSPLGVGSDLGGSNRLPSHYCGIVGFKATHGRVPLTGHWPELMVRCMHAGPIARSIRDVALATSILSGSDGKDPYATATPAADFSGLKGPLPPLKIGYTAAGPFAPVDREIRDAVTQAAAALGELGCQVEEVSLVGWEERMPIDLCYVFLKAEGVQYLTSQVGDRRDELSPQIQGLMDLEMPTTEEYLDALNGFEQLKADVAGVLSRVDVLLLPTVPFTAPPHDSGEIVVDGVKVVAGLHSAAITATFGLTGSPAVSVPFAYSSEGMPIGVQLAGNHYDEATVLRAAAALEARCEMRRPDV